MAANPFFSRTKALESYVAKPAPVGLPLVFQHFSSI
jgi:hypothetical protein